MHSLLLHIPMMKEKSTLILILRIQVYVKSEMQDNEWCKCYQYTLNCGLLFDKCVHY